MLNVGDKAPEFSLKDQDGKTHKLSQYKGKKVIVYFYPRDDTPGCTTEACSFRDSFSDFKKKGAVILGISADDEKSHKKFAEKYSLPFTLLSDPGHETLEKYGAWTKKSMYGKVFMGIQRITYLIDEKGKVMKAFKKVKPDEHAEELLALLSSQENI